MTNKIFKHFTGTLEDFKQWLSENPTAKEALGDSLVFIHPDDDSEHGHIYAQGEYYITDINADYLWKKEASGEVSGILEEGTNVHFEKKDGKLVISATTDVEAVTVEYDEEADKYYEVSGDSRKEIVDAAAKGINGEGVYIKTGDDAEAQYSKITVDLTDYITRTEYAGKVAELEGDIANAQTTAEKGVADAAAAQATADQAVEDAAAAQADATQALADAATAQAAAEAAQADVDALEALVGEKPEDWGEGDTVISKLEAVAAKAISAEGDELVSASIDETDKNKVVVAATETLTDALDAAAAHIADEDIHVTADEKDAWDAKLDAVEGATEGNLAALDEYGKLTDSGIPGKFASVDPESFDPDNIEDPSLANSDGLVIGDVLEAYVKNYVSYRLEWEELGESASTEE